MTEKFSDKMKNKDSNTNKYFFNFYSCRSLENNIVSFKNSKKMIVKNKLLSLRAEGEIFPTLGL